MLEPCPDWSPLGVNFKILDEHPYLFYISSPPPGPKVGSSQLLLLPMKLVSRFADIVSVEQFIEDQENENTKKKTQENVALLKEYSDAGERVKTHSFVCDSSQLVNKNRTHSPTMK